MIDFRKLIEQLLERELGTWQYSNGQTRPSIAVIPPFINQQTIIATPGVEALIVQKPTYKSAATFAVNYREPYYRIILTQYDRDSTLNNCDRLLNFVFDGIEFQATPRRERIKKTGVEIEEETAQVLIPADKDFSEGRFVSEITEALKQVYG